MYIAPHVLHLMRACETASSIQARGRSGAGLPVVFMLERDDEAQGRAFGDAHFFGQLTTRVVVVTARTEMRVGLELGTARHGTRPDSNSFA